MLLAIPIYLLEGLGAFFVLIFSDDRFENRQVPFHAAQSLLFYGITSIIFAVLANFGLEETLIDHIRAFSKIAFTVFGGFYLITNRKFELPIISKLACKIMTM